jgi:hypothetical protein
MYVQVMDDWTSPMREKGLEWMDEEKNLPGWRGNKQNI